MSIGVSAHDICRDSRDSRADVLVRTLLKVRSPQRQAHYRSASPE
jgi:hypothetical protein